MGLKLYNLLRLPGTYAAIIGENQTPLHVSLNNSVIRPYLKTLRGGGLILSILAAYVPGNLK